MTGAEEMRKLIDEFERKTIIDSENFDLAAYLKTIPLEELRQQYTDYKVYAESTGYGYFRPINEVNIDQFKKAQDVAEEIKGATVIKI